MSDQTPTLWESPSVSIALLERRRKSGAILQAVQRFAEEVPLTLLQRQLLGLIIDEAIADALPKYRPLTARDASNDRA